LAQIDSIDNLVTEFEKVAPTIEQLLQMAVEAAELKKKLDTAHDEATKKLAEIEAARQKLGQNLADVGSLKQRLESRIAASETLDKNVGDDLRKIKREVLGEIGNLDAKRSELDNAVKVFLADKAQLLADKASLADLVISDLKKAKGSELDGLKVSLEATLQNFKAQSAPLLADIPAQLLQLDADKQSAISAFKATVNNAIASLPSQFDQLKGQLAQAMQTHVANEVQQFLVRQNNLVANLNQRIDALENLNRTQLDSVLAKMNSLEEVLEKRGDSFLGLFRRGR